MSLYVELRDKYKEGYERGAKEGELRNNELYAKLLEQKREKDMIRAVSDEEYRRKLMEELGI